MQRNGTGALFVAGALFLVFLANVVAGAFAKAAFLSDIWEMLGLFAACGFFVAAVLQREQSAIRKKTENQI